MISRLLSAGTMDPFTSSAFQSPSYSRLKLPDDSVAAYSADFAAALGRTPRFCSTIRQAASFRDAGKKLAKEQGLTADEKGMSSEQTISQRITVESRLARRHLSNKSDPVLQMASDIATCYRERWDGKGFPDGLTAHEIPVAARIVAICLTFEALTMETRYGTEWSWNDALVYIQKQAECRFDPYMVPVFLQIQTEHCLNQGN